MISSFACSVLFVFLFLRGVEIRKKRASEIHIYIYIYTRYIYKKGTSLLCHLFLSVFLFVPSKLEKQIAMQQVRH